LGTNEAVFRDINERIEAGQWPGEPDKPIAFRCECASLGCNMLIELAHSAMSVYAQTSALALVPAIELAESNSSSSERRRTWC